ncbi:hypothetical protein [Rhodocyclus tenuis]|uniref:hypothetical protein n=1 Tax=Rhodocyclus tenuis TaxID=1066 RepID=UPI0019044CA3|nr:hypothetical protein [Rhodocyclus tenuis]MBK1680894.1 hypothetical protein [Rhodocyclus tenuis]
MLPLLPFAAGLLAGAVSVKLLRSDKTRDGLNAAKTRLRAATVSGLNKLEHSTAAVRERLETADDAPAAPASEAVAALTAVAEEAPAKVSTVKPRRKPAPAKRTKAAKPAADAGGAA